MSDVCCKPTAGSVVNDSNLQCNSSVWWTDPPGIGPADPTVSSAQYNFGFYVDDYAPSPGSGPWWIAGATANPYAGGGAKLQYVNVVRDGKAPSQSDAPRAYSYAHDDAWNTIVCGTISPLNEEPSDSRGIFYKRYDMRVVIGKTA